MSVGNLLGDRDAKKSGETPLILEGRNSGAPRARTLGLSWIDDAAIASVVLNGSVECESEGRLLVLDAEGRTARIAARFPTLRAAGSLVFAPFPDRGMRIYAFDGGEGSSSISSLEETPVLGLEQAGNIVGSVAALVEDGEHAVVLAEVKYGSGPPSQSILSMDLSRGDGEWTAIDTGGLALSPGRVVTTLAMNAGRLHAAVADPIGGCDLFCLPVADPKLGWAPVFTRGADRFALNAAVSVIASVGRDLLLGTAALATGAIAVGNWGPELLIVGADGSWDLLIGQPRLSASGLRLPASALMPGIDSPENAAIKAIASGKVGDAQRTFIALQSYSGTEPGDRGRLRPLLSDYRGHTRFFASDNMIDWAALDVSLPPGAGAVTSLCATPSGLLIGHEAVASVEAPVTFVPI
jgi:hypothetical protein